MDPHLYDICHVFPTNASFGSVTQNIPFPLSLIKNTVYYLNKIICFCIFRSQIHRVRERASGCVWTWLPRRTRNCRSIIRWIAKMATTRKARPWLGKELTLPSLTWPLQVPFPIFLTLFMPFSSFSSFSLPCFCYGLTCSKYMCNYVGVTVYHISFFVYMFWTCQRIGVSFFPT